MFKASLTKLKKIFLTLFLDLIKPEIRYVALRNPIKDNIFFPVNNLLSAPDFKRKRYDIIFIYLFK